MKITQVCRLFDWNLEQIKSWIKMGVLSESSRTRPDGMSLMDIIKCNFMFVSKSRGISTQTVKSFTSQDDIKWEILLEHDWLVFKDSEHWYTFDTQSQVVAYLVLDSCFGGHYVFDLGLCKQQVADTLKNAGLAYVFEGLLVGE